MRALIILIFIVGILFILYSVFSEKLDISVGDPSLPIVSIRGERIFVEVADTPQERFRGLSNRTSIPPNRGVLFVFDELDRYGFVMRDMFFGLDFLWISENWEIVHINHNVPENYPDTLRPPEPVRYVLELNAGWAQKHNVRIGDRVDTSLLGL